MIPAIGLVSKDLLGSMVEVLDRVLETAFISIGLPGWLKNEGCLRSLKKVAPK